MPRNPSLFRKMAEPFENAEAANKATEEFWKDVQAAREKHKITNVYVILSSPYMIGEDEGDAMLCGMLGDQLRAEQMAAYAFGIEQANHEERIAEQIKTIGNRKRRKIPADE